MKLLRVWSSFNFTNPCLSFRALVWVLDSIETYFPELRFLCLSDNKLFSFIDTFILFKELKCKADCLNTLLKCILVFLNLLKCLLGIFPFYYCLSQSLYMFVGRRPAIYFTASRTVEKGNICLYRRLHLCAYFVCLWFLQSCQEYVCFREWFLPKEVFLFPRCWNFFFCCYNVLQLISAFLFRFYLFVATLLSLLLLNFVFHIFCCFDADVDFKRHQFHRIYF